MARRLRGQLERQMSPTAMTVKVSRPGPNPSVNSFFVPRPNFPQLDSLVRSYFLGHHQAALTEMSQMLSTVELIIECRDHRVPLSSRNPLFEKALAGRERLMVYTKKDLAQGTLNKIQKNAITKWHSPNKVMFSDVNNFLDVKKILSYARSLYLPFQAETAKQVDNLTGSRMLIVGMPNVGKSSLLNALRRVGVQRKKAAITGGQPGVTRKIATSVKVIEDPLIYLIDSPGVFVPYVPNSETMLKLALVGMNLHDPTIYKKYHEPTNNILDFLAKVGKETGRLMKGGEPDLEATALWIVGRWRNGLLGRFMLDPVDKDAYQRWLEEEESAGKSNTRLKKEAKAERLEAQRPRNVAMA
ncbi:P-loop containing nucleoside triphosphate hydrolase protein [Terfezia boudieri ATCC MYA-4762]|uniref:P-loop containing nucleoside triphosphate hydrolase protein n=1 Tax=Terfezia boudieri ATCC MYA-4762 TaxID=1051890 RepID=A0A3N4LW41_9PEZI|nr:P-loop containing nucleoside triphosphate hydrolase protein [Terfezia boudieri ATCC MYA-4762]